MGVWKIWNPESGNENGTSELKTGDALRVLLTIVAQVKVFFLIHYIHFLIVACCLITAKFIVKNFTYM